MFGGGHVRQVAFSQGEGCLLTDAGRVSCTRSTKAPPNGVFGSSVLEIVGSSDGFCAATTSGVWCWNGYSLLFSIFG